MILIIVQLLCNNWYKYILVNNKIKNNNNLYKPSSSFGIRQPLRLKKKQQLFENYVILKNNITISRIKYSFRTTAFFKSEQFIGGQNKMSPADGVFQFMLLLLKGTGMGSN